MDNREAEGVISVDPIATSGQSEKGVNPDVIA
jgi:hypothetical protein